MGLSFDYQIGQTPLSEEEKEGLRVGSITTRQDLDEFEQQNIDKAIERLAGKKFKVEKLLTERFVKDLHREMFGDVWTWAGEFRRSDKSIGVDWRIISVEIKKLLDNCYYWLDNKIFSEEEIAIRLSHGLVKIHPFVNGNGRHSRLIADVMMEKIFYKDIFSWGKLDLESINNERSRYIVALRKADEGDYNCLLTFAQGQ
jgi:Fic-DOC domain mobile mystery protein B